MNNALADLSRQLEILSLSIEQFDGKFHFELKTEKDNASKLRFSLPVDPPLLLLLNVTSLALQKWGST